MRPTRSRNRLQQQKEQAAAAAAAAAPPVSLGPVGLARPPATWIDAVLKAINSRREAHWALPLVWSDSCYVAAKRQADRCVEEGYAFFGNTETLDGTQGQCIKGPLNPPQPLKSRLAEDVVNTWYQEGVRFRFDDPEPDETTGNFAQLVWSNTSSVGMALSEDGKYVVANFFPGIGEVPDYFYAKWIRKPTKLPPPWLPKVHPEGDAQAKDASPKAAEPRASEATDRSIPGRAGGDLDATLRRQDDPLASTTSSGRDPLATEDEYDPLCDENWEAHEALTENIETANIIRPELEEIDFEKIARENGWSLGE
mmetsp:Transcript_27307/g.59341  ORF Transcript_27307/g.59341 Transcript_27307/m.59341 type:complete len:311 (-) Transcript_27307:176-1108(-)